jgi:DNA primase
MRNKILSLLSSILGEPHNTTRDNYSYYCPNCKHRKRKLEIDVNKGLWHCWVCNRGGKNFFSLFKWINAGQDKVNELRTIVGSIRRRFTDKVEYKESICQLPSEFKPLWVMDSGNFFWRAAINYLNSRDIHIGEILKYGIGYCTEGPYRNMIIIPSYDVNGQLNYFVSRSFMPNARPIFKNPPVNKNVVGFEMMINWNEPIILVESAFDAIAIRRNAVPLFGKTISKKLKERIVKSNVGEVNICLDGDAISDAINHVGFFLGNGVNVRVTELQMGDDPSSLGYDSVWHHLSNATCVDEYVLFERRIKDHINGEGKTYLPRRRRALSVVSKAQGISGSF